MVNWPQDMRIWGSGKERDCEWLQKWEVSDVITQLIGGNYTIIG